jgi:hypothetical protein
LRQNPTALIQCGIESDRPPPRQGMGVSTFTLNNNPVDLRFGHFAIVLIYLNQDYKFLKTQKNQFLSDKNPKKRPRAIFKVKNSESHPFLKSTPL